MSEPIVMVDRSLLRIPFDDSDRTVSLADLLDGLGVSVPGECGGVGKCGFCLVRIVSGLCSPPTPAEYSTLDEDEIRDGYRLACQVRVQGDIELSLGEQSRG